jgi:hypothetical protein
MLAAPVSPLAPDLLEDRAANRLHDPRAESARPWRTYRRQVQDLDVTTSEFLYSPYQLLLIPELQSIPAKSRRRNQDFSHPHYSLKLSDQTHNRLSRALADNEMLTITLSALDTRYRPFIVGTMTNHSSSRIEPVHDYIRDFKPKGMLKWLGCSPDDLREEAERLLAIASGIDPLGRWYHVIRQGDPEKWQELKGDALVACDRRLAAEILLQFYEDLVREQVAAPLPLIPRLAPHPLKERLTTRDEGIDEVLMEFELSPQPRLILVLEGETEELIVPQVMRMLGIPLRDDFIELVNARGIQRNFDPLASFAITPRLGHLLRDAAQLVRPPTHFYVVMDAEGKFKTAEERSNWRENRIDLIKNSVQWRYNISAAREDIAHLIHIDTWNPLSSCFEFAHFTDDQLARGITQIYDGPSMPHETKLLERLADFRARQVPVEHVWSKWKGRKPTKVQLAQVLWPDLERKIAGGIKAGTLDNTPVARVLLRARELAMRTPRNRVVIRTP